MPFVLGVEGERVCAETDQLDAHYDIRMGACEIAPAAALVSALHLGAARAMEYVVLYGKAIVADAHG